MKKDFVYETKGTIAPDGAIVLSNFSFYKFLFEQEGLLGTGKEVIVKITPYQRRRSNAQNRYIHGVVIPAVQKWKLNTQGVQWSHDATYLWLRRALLEDDLVIEELDGYQIPVLKGTRFSQMTVEEFSHAVFDVIIPKLAEMGCVVPLPKGDNFLSDFV